MIHYLLKVQNKPYLFKSIMKALNLRGFLYLVHTIYTNGRYSHIKSKNKMNNKI